MSNPKPPRSQSPRAKLRGDREDKEFTNLLDVGSALSAEHDSDKILEMILEKATENTNADGGSIYLVERVKQDSIGGTRSKFVPMLRFSHALNFTLKKKSNEVS